MLILQDATAVQFEPAQVQSGIDIAVEGSLIKAVGAGLAAQVSAGRGPAAARPTGHAGHRLFAQPLLLGPRARHHGQHRAVPGLHLHAEEPLVAAGPGAGRGVALLQRPRLLARSHQERLHRRHRSPCVAQLHWRLARHPAQGLPGSRPARHHLLRNHAPQRRGRRAQGRCRRERGLRPPDRRGQGEGRRTLSGGGHDRCARAVHDFAPWHGAAARSRADDGARPAHPRGRGPLRRFPRPRCPRPGPDRTPGLAPTRRRQDPGRPWPVPVGRRHRDPQCAATHSWCTTRGPT